MGKALKRCHRATWIAAISAVIALALVGCSGDGLNSPTGRGVVVFDLETPYTDDGALIVTVGGGAVDSITVGAGRHVYTSPAAAGMNVVVTGAIGAGQLLKVYVPDAKRIPSYTATVVQAAARSTYVLRESAGYRLVRR